MNSAALRRFGFRRGLVLGWGNEAHTYEIAADTNSDWRMQNVIYAWVDAAQDRCLNVGHTGQTLRARFKAGYERWLNGLLKGDVDTPIRQAWLSILASCQPSKVEIWIKPSSVDRLEREAEESQWMTKLGPLLNKRGYARVPPPLSSAFTTSRALIGPKKATRVSTGSSQKATPSDGVARIGALDEELQRACRQLCEELRSWSGVSETVAARYVGYSVDGRSFCQLHAKPTAGYVWMHVPKGNYDSSFVFENRAYLGDTTRFRLTRAIELDDVRRICRASYKTVVR